MTLNATIIIQIFNFLVGYVLISKFFLKPAYDVMKKEEHYTLDLQQKRDSELDIVRAKETEKHRDWLSCQNYFHDHKPQVDKVQEVIRKNKSGIQVEAFDAEKIASLEKEVIEKLEAKILQ